MSDLDRFEVFSYVVERGSLTQAAEHLGCTKAAVSKQIKRLEADFSINLFTRHKQRLHLTPEGEQLYQQCLRLRKELQAARNMCENLHAEPAGEMHVVVFQYFAKRLVFPRLREFLARYPKLRLRIGTTEKVPDFSQKSVDLVMGFSLLPPNIDETIQKKMMTTRYVLCATPTYFEQYGKPKQLSDLDQHRYLCHTSRSVQHAIRLKPNQHYALTPYLWLNCVTSIIECALQHIGIVQLPLYMVDNYLRSGELVEVLTECQANADSVFCYYPKSVHMQPKIKAFMEFFLPDG
jgi:DNA-binding transcriptional LysR family regulator